MKNKLIAGAAALAAAVGIGAIIHVGAARATSPTPPPGSSLVGVTDQHLQLAGVYLGPTSASPSVTQAAAEAAAIKAFPQATVRSSAFLHVRMPNTVPAMDKDAWAVSLTAEDYSDGPSGANRSKATYMVVIIDGTDGHIITAVDGT